MRLHLLACILAMTAASGAQAESLTGGYICPDGTAFFARPGPQGVVLDFGGRLAERLDARPEVGPGVYRQGADEFRFTRRGAILARAGRPPVSCRGLDVHDLPLPPFE